MPHERITVCVAHALFSFQYFPFQREGTSREGSLGASDRTLSAVISVPMFQRGTVLVVVKDDQVAVLHW